jgi:methylmalonyl-CoA/ethylmalonyl-CoA epimerase
MTEIKSSVAIPPIQKISAVVNDVAATSQFFSSMWNVTSWKNTENNFTQGQMTLGSPGKVKVARAKLGQVTLELLQPLAGDTLWSRLLEANGEGLSYIGFVVDDPDLAELNLKSCEAELLAEIQETEAKRQTYWKLKPSGLIIELQNKTDELGLSPPEDTSPDQPDLYHISCFISDIEQTCQLLSTLWGLGPWRKVQQKLEKDWTELVSGEPCEIKLAFTKLNPIVLELIQPVTGQPYWYKFIQEKGEGLNHIAFSVNDWQEMAARLKSAGGKMVAGGVQDGMHWGYFRTEPGGIVVELEEKVGGKQQFQV